MANNWNRTQMMRERLNYEIEEVNGVPHYQDIPVISRDTPIDGGVYLGANEREAIVVDFSNSPKIKELYSATQARARGVIEKLTPQRIFYNREMIPLVEATDEDIVAAISNRDINPSWYNLLFERKVRCRIGNAKLEDVTEENILRAAYQTVSKIKTHESNSPERRSSSHLGGDKLIGLDELLNDDEAVCRHKSLVIGVIIEKLKKENILNGESSIDRNENYNGAHAWCRYTDARGNIFILDAEKGYFGLLENARVDSWNYQRPADKEYVWRIGAGIPIDKLLEAGKDDKNKFKIEQQQRLRTKIEELKKEGITTIDQLANVKAQLGRWDEDNWGPLHYTLNALFPALKIGFEEKN